MSDIKEIKPHDKPEEYNFEDYPVPETDRNRVSAIFMNWVKSKLLSLPYIVESKRISDGGSFTYYEKWSDGRLIVRGQLDMTNTTPANEMRITVFDKDFPTPVPFVGLKTYCDTQPYIYDGTSSFGQFEIYFMRVSPLTNGGSLYIKKTSGGWTNNQRRMGVAWSQEGFWK